MPESLSEQLPSPLQLRAKLEAMVRCNLLGQPRRDLGRLYAVLGDQGRQGGPAIGFFCGFA